MPVGEVDSHGSAPWYKETPKSRAGTKGVGRAIVPLAPLGQNNPAGGKGPYFGDARAARDGRGHGASQLPHR